MLLIHWMEAFWKKDAFCTWWKPSGKDALCICWYALLIFYSSSSSLNTLGSFPLSHCILNKRVILQKQCYSLKKDDRIALCICSRNTYFLTGDTIIPLFAHNAVNILFMMHSCLPWCSVIHDVSKIVWVWTRNIQAWWQLCGSFCSLAILCGLLEGLDTEVGLLQFYLCFLKICSIEFYNYAAHW